VKENVFIRLEDRPILWGRNMTLCPQI